MHADWPDACESVLFLPTALYLVDDKKTSWPLELQFLAVGYGTATGIVAAAVFWLLRRPDRDRRPTQNPLHESV